MVDTTKGFYLDLEQKLYALRTHFGMCKNLKNEDVLEWAKFFQAWSKEASSFCEPWAKETLVLAAEIVRNLEGTRNAVTGTEILERVMVEAAQNLNREIVKGLRQGDGLKESAPLR